MHANSVAQYNYYIIIEDKWYTCVTNLTVAT